VLLPSTFLLEEEFNAAEWIAVVRRDRKNLFSRRSPPMSKFRPPSSSGHYALVTVIPRQVMLN
jgi:hypothetical protein